jgi:DNA-directed RNA polymerase specialized sigma24 family protein
VSIPKAAPNKNWVLTQEAFDRFLTTLDGDRDKAGEEYEHIRLQLLKYFQWGGSDVPDIDADETLNRVTRRLDEGQVIHNLRSYIYGVAKLVRAESLKRRHRKQGLDEASLIHLSAMDVNSETPSYQQCLDRCLSHLRAEDRQILTEYYRYEKSEKITTRKLLAARLGISSNTLRVRMHRQRSILEACVDKCLIRTNGLTKG